MEGSAMRAAARVAGITVGNTAFRGVTSDHYPFFSAVRRAAASRSAAAMVEDVKLVGPQSLTGVKTTSSDMEDWVFAGEEEAIASDADPMPRVVFGGSPTLQEAKEATSELAVALQKAYVLSPDSAGQDGSLVADRYFGLSISGSGSGSQVMDNESVTSETAAAPSVPVNAIKAFRLLNESEVTQNIVASIACDPNVWDAVLQNPELQEFMQSQRACFSCSNTNHPSAESAESTDASSANSEPPNHIRFMDIVQKVKITVVDMMSNLSGYFENFFGVQVGNNRVLARYDGTASAEALMEASFVGLAVMAVMVILVKRV